MLPPSKPTELIKDRPMQLHGGLWSTTTRVWEVLEASLVGDLERVREASRECPELLTCQYDYTSPIHFAVREGHRELVEFLVAQRALDPNCSNHPFLEPIVTIAEDRGHGEIATLLREALADPSTTRDLEDIGAIKRDLDAHELELQDHVSHGRIQEVERMLTKQPDLVQNEEYFWGEGILAKPAKDPNHEMIELLMSFGAQVPEVSKWGARYYFKHLPTAELLLKKGMNPNHRHWKGFILLHDFAFTGDVEKCRLLLEFGADIDAVDEEYQSTPLGYAAHFGHVSVAELLIQSGANRDLAGGPWAKPLAWANRRANQEMVAVLAK